MPVVAPYPIPDADPGSRCCGGRRGRTFGSLGAEIPGRLGATTVRGIYAVGCNVRLSGSSMGEGHSGWGRCLTGPLASLLRWHVLLVVLLYLILSRVLLKCADLVVAGWGEQPAYQVRRGPEALERMK